MELTWWWLGLAVLLVILGVAGAAWGSARREPSVKSNPLTLAPR